MNDLLSFQESVSGSELLLGSQQTKVLSVSEERRLIAELVATRKMLIEQTTGLPESAQEGASGFDDFQRLIRAIREGKAGGEKNAELNRLVTKYEELRHRLALANIRLVAYAAKRYLNRGVALSDLIQEGFCGLLVGIDRFDPVNGTRLATYALWWIKQALRRTVSANAYPVRLNPKLLRQVAIEHEEIAHDAQSSKPHVTATLKSIRCAIRPTVSFDAMSETGMPTALVERMKSPANHDREDMENGEYVGHMMRVLTPREQTVIRLRFGLDDKRSHSLSEISQILDVSKERVRQIQEKALEKLRASEHVDVYAREAVN